MHQRVNFLMYSTSFFFIFSYHIFGKLNKHESVKDKSIGLLYKYLNITYLLINFL